jgi:hypothetical protein
MLGTRQNSGLFCSFHRHYHHHHHQPLTPPTTHTTTTTSTHHRLRTPPPLPPTTHTTTTAHHQPPTCPSPFTTLPTYPPTRLSRYGDGVFLKVDYVRVYQNMTSLSTNNNATTPATAANKPSHVDNRAKSLAPSRDVEGDAVGAASQGQRRVNWFTSGGGWTVGTDGLNLTQWISTHRGAITGTFPCCGCWGIADNGTFTNTGRCASLTSADPAQRLNYEAVVSAGLTIEPTGAFPVEWVMSEAWLKPGVLQSAVDMLKREGWDGLAIDNEE